MFDAHILSVSLGIPGLEKKSLMVITSLVHDSGVIKVYFMAKLIRVLCNLGVTVSNSHRPLT